MRAICKAFPRLDITAWLLRALPLMALLTLAMLWLMRDVTETRDINTDKVRGKVSNLDWSYLSVDPTPFPSSWKKRYRMATPRP